MADSDSIFARAGFSVARKPTEESPASAGSAPAPAPKQAAPSRGLFEAAGFRTAATPPVVQPDSDIPTPEKFAEGWKQQGGALPVKSSLQQLREDIDPARLATIAAKNAYHDTIETAAAGWQMAKQGASEVKAGNYLPSAPSIDPRTWSAGGLLKTAAGLTSAVTSPISGLTNALVERPVTELTGNPEIGERAGLVAGSLLPVKGAAKTGNALSPETKAVGEIVKAVGAENVPEAVAALRANPRMTLADVSDPVRLTTQGLMAGGSPEVQDFIGKAVRARNASRLEATNTAFTEAMGPAPDVPAMIEGLKERAVAISPEAQTAAARTALDQIMGKAGNPYDELQKLQANEAAANSPKITRDGLDQVMGHSTNPHDELQAMLEKRSQDAAPLYEKALQRPVAWDGRLQQFIDDPIVKSGLAKGVRIQRLESLAEGKPFNPSDYAIKGFNEAGDPVIGETPNMRTLNVVKKGLDTLVEDSKDSVTGRLSEEGRAIDRVRGAFLQKLDQINPDYAAARQAWAGPSAAHDAFNRGLNLFQNRSGSSGINSTPEALQSWMKGASDAEKEAAKIGARTAFEQQMKAASDPAAKAAGLANKEVNRDKLAVLFGRDQANKIADQLNFKYEDPIGTSFSRGMDVFQNRTGASGIESTPEALEAWYKTATPQQREAAKIGARTAFEQQMKAASDPAAKAAGLANKEVNRDKLAVLFGRDQANKIADQLNFKYEDPIGKAFEQGFDVLKNRSGITGLQDRPDALREWMKTATPEEVVAKRLGVRSDIDQKINGVKNGALAGQTVTAIPYNREKLVMLFGEPEAKRLIRVMEDSTREAQTSAAITAGSKTAETKAAAERIKEREVGGGNPLNYVAPVAAELLGQSAGIPFAGLAASVAGKGALMGAQKAGQLMDRARNYSFARNALATGPARETTINALLSHPKVISELKKRANALTVP